MSWLSNAWNASKNWVGDRWNELTGQAQTEQVNTQNVQMAETAYNRDLEMWNRANAYNAPSAQMERLHAGGLNPNLIYGTGSSAAVGNSGQMPKYNAPQMQRAPNIDYLGMTASILNMFTNFKQRDAQTDLAREQARKTIQETTLVPEKRSILRQEVQRGGIRTNILQNQQDQSQFLVDNQQQVLDANLENLRKRTDSIIQDVRWKTDTYDLRRKMQQIDYEIKDWMNKFKAANLAAGLLGRIIP